MKIATWNVNSIKARLEHTLAYLQGVSPDVLMIQELKGLEFPEGDIKSIGYHCAHVGQKAYNGVAILSKTPINEIFRALPGDDADEQARYLEVETGGLRLINIYLPNGNPWPSEKFDYKLRWMGRLKDRLQTLRREGISFAVGGDFNIIPEDKDCHDPRAWASDALFRIESRQRYRALINLGLTDAFRIRDERAGQYTFWDYQAGAWQNNNGIRIDHFLLSPAMADRFQSCIIDTGPRDLEKPSDHTPVILEVA